MYKYIFLCIVVMMLCTACSANNPAATKNPSNTDTQTQTQLSQTQVTESETPKQTDKKPEANRDDVELLNTNELAYQYTIDELKKMRSDLSAKGSIDELLPNERFNALLMDYYIDYQDNQEKIWSSMPDYSSDYSIYPINTEAEVDLNGDGIVDKIIVKPIYNEEFQEGVSLKVNDIETTYNNYYNIAPNFAIVDIDKSDSYKEILISDLGPSSDNTSIFYWYDGKTLTFMNKDCNKNRPMPESHRDWISDEIGGLYDEIECMGDGIITATQRASLLQTWRHPIRYQLNKDHMLEVIPEIFEVDYPVFTLLPLTLYTERDINSPTILMDKEITVKLSAIDDIEWVQVTLPSGEKGWFMIKDFMKIVTIDGEFDATDVFFFLLYAD